MLERQLKYPTKNHIVAEEQKSGKGAQIPQSDEQNLSQPALFDYERLANIISKRSLSAEDSVLKGYFKHQGLSPEEASKAIHSFKETKLLQLKAEQKKYQHILSENAKLKTQVLNTTIDLKVCEFARIIGISQEKIPFLLKLLDRTNSLKEDGTLNEGAIESSIKDVLNAFPEMMLKIENNTGFRQLGSGGDSTGSTEADDLVTVF